MIAYIAWMPLLSNLLPMLQVLFLSIGKVKHIAIRNFIIAVMRLLIVSIACFVTKNIGTIIKLLFLLDVIQVLYFFAAFRKYKFAVKPKDFDIHMVLDILEFCIPMAVYIMTNALSRDIDKYVISFFTDTEMLAVYTNAAKVLPFDLVTASFLTVMIPIVTQQIAKKDYAQARLAFKSYLRMGYLVTWILAFGAVIVAKELMIFLYDEKYLAGLGVFIIYLFVDMIRFANSSLILSAKGKTKILMYCSLGALVINFVFNIFAFKMLGIIGPAIATLIIAFILTLVLLKLSTKEIKCSIKDIIDGREILIIIMQLILVGLACYVLKNILYFVTASTTLILIIAYGFYLLVMLFFNRNRVVSCLRTINELK